MAVPVKNSWRLPCDVSQVWYADDAAVARKIDRLCEWWSQLASQGPKFGYFPNAAKTWLVTKEIHHATAQGRSKHLGAGPAMDAVKTHP